MRRLLPSSLARYAWKSGRNSAQDVPALVTFCQTRARAPSSVAESMSSSLISWSARSRRSSDIADLLLAFHLSLQPVPDPVEPDSHVVLLDLEQPGQFFVRQPLDVTQQEQAGVLAVQDSYG